MPYDYATSFLNLTAANTPLQLFGGRPNRKTLIVSAAVNGTTFVAYGESNFNSKIFCRLTNSQTLVLKYEDYGPLITGEIWVSCTAGIQTANGAEIFPIARRR